MKFNYTTGSPKADAQQVRSQLRNKRYSSLERVLRVITDNLDVSSSIRDLLISFINEILIVSKYMFVLRYEPSAPKVKARSSRPSNDDLMKLDFLETPFQRKVAPVRTSATDVIKAFKELEQYVYHEKWVSDDFNPELGVLAQNYANLSRILPILLLESKGIADAVIRQKVLSIIHSSICIYRQFAAKAVPDVHTIIGPYNGAISLAEAEEKYFADSTIDAWLDTIPDLESVKDYFRLQIYSGNASSPAGGSHDVNILQDVNSIWREFGIRDAIRSISTHFKGGDEFMLLVENLFANTAWDHTFPRTKASRIVTFTAPGAKARTIAIADWVSQTALSAIHFGSFQLLRLLKSDRTFNHPSGLDLFRNVTENFYSLDLSAATDRLPRVLQARVLARILSRLGFDGEIISRDWLTIIDREYDTRGSAYEKITDAVRYAVGNGMGLFSSWTTMALTHHYIVFLCGVPQEDYSLVGDDLLIRGHRPSFEKYLKIMTDIGVGVNTKKTIVSEDQPPTIEFARNWVISGIRLLPLHFGVLFAWVDENITSETVIWHLKPYLTPGTIDEIMDILDVRNGLLSKMQIYYYLFRESLIPEKQLSLLISAVPEFGKYSITLLSRIKQVTASARLKIVTKDKVIKGFYDTLLSQCIVRKPEELSFVVNFASSIYMIAFADERLIEPAEKFHRRALDANLIKYDVDIKGGPLLTKRERNLIKDLLVRDKVIREPTSKKPGTSRVF